MIRTQITHRTLTPKNTTNLIENAKEINYKEDSFLQSECFYTQNHNAMVIIGPKSLYNIFFEPILSKIKSAKLKKLNKNENRNALRMIYF